MSDTSPHSYDHKATLLKMGESTPKYNNSESNSNPKEANRKPQKLENKNRREKKKTYGNITENHENSSW